MLADVCVVYAEAQLEREIWRLLAYVARYGHQPLSVATQWTVRELGVFADEISRIVAVENKPGAE